MSPQDLPRFKEIFSGLERLLVSRRLEAGEHDRLLSDYFRALRPYPIEAIRGGAEVCAQRAKHFPKPVEWIEAMPRPDLAADVPLMSGAEARDYRAAERTGWEMDPCGCQACHQAGVSHLPLRYVPDVDREGAEARRKDENGRLVTAGHWAHGQELRRYYDAKAAFFTAAQTLGQTAVARLVTGRR